MQSYARFGELVLLPLDLLELEIQQESRWYASTLYDLLETEARNATRRIEARLRHPILPRRHTRKIRVEEPRTLMPLEAWLIQASTVYSIISEDSTQAKSRTQLDESVWDYDPNTDHIDWMHSEKDGWFDVTGLWGVADSDILERDSILDELVVDGSVLAGATTLQLTTEPVFEGGEILHDRDGKQALVVSSISGKTVTLDGWCVPERAIADQAELVLCGRIHPTFERLVLLDAFLQAWRKISPLPPHSARTGQTFDGDAYEREVPSEVLSIAEERERLFDVVTGHLSPVRLM